MILCAISQLSSAGVVGERSCRSVVRTVRTLKKESLIGFLTGGVHSHIIHVEPSDMFGGSFLLCGNGGVKIGA